MLTTKKSVHIADVRLEQAYLDRNPSFVDIVDLGGARTLLIVPMLKENVLIGAIGIYRQEVRPFADKHMELVSNFAACAKRLWRSAMDTDEQVAQRAKVFITFRVDGTQWVRTKPTDRPSLSPR